MTLKELIKIKDLHGAQIARRVGVHRATMNRWLNGDTKIKPVMIPVLADALGVEESVVKDCIAKKD